RGGGVGHAPAHAPRRGFPSTGLRAARGRGLAGRRRLRTLGYIDPFASTATDRLRACRNGAPSPSSSEEGPARLTNLFVSRRGGGGGSRLGALLRAPPCSTKGPAAPDQVSLLL